MMLSKNEFNELKKVDTKDSLSTESTLFYLPEDQIYKYFLINTKENLENKERIIEKLFMIKKENNFKEIVFPNDKVYIERNFSGYSMPFINGNSLHHFMHAKDHSFEQKKQILIKIGNLLEKIKEYREKTNKCFYLNDLHEHNILVDNEEINIIDMDSAYVENTVAAPSKYLLKKGFFKDDVKYPKHKINSAFSNYQVTPNTNTEVFCYIIMILNFLSDSNITLLGEGFIQQYIEYLSNLDLPLRLTQSFKSILYNKDNINPAPFLEDLKENPQTDIRQSKIIRR